jgi:fructokinase
MKMTSASIVGLGEVLWDVLPSGARLGGAPANFAVSCGKLGARADVASAIGNDALGLRTRDELAANGAGVDFLQTNGLPTSEVTVRLDAHGHASYTIERPVAWDQLAWTDQWAELAVHAEAICFGTLAQRSSASRATLRRFIVETRPDAVRVFDVNLRSPFWDEDTLAWGVQHATVLKLNEDEIPAVLQSLGLGSIAGKDDEALAATTLLRAGRALQLVCITLGSRGCVLTTRDEQVHHPGFATQVADTVGAGDAFTAAMVTYFMREAPLVGIAAAANRLGSYVASQHGAMPPFPPELLAELDMLAKGGK